MSDFSGQSQLNVEWDIDVDTNFTTITIKDVGDVELGTIIIENNRCRTLLESLATMAKELFPDPDINLQGSKTTLHKNTGLATIEFG